MLRSSIPIWVRMAAQRIKSTSVPHVSPSWDTRSAWKRTQSIDRSANVEKADSTLRTSQAVPHPSTIRALSRLTSEVERDPVHSTRYGRQRKPLLLCVWRRSALCAEVLVGLSLSSINTVTVAILAQGTLQAVAISQAFFHGFNSRGGRFQFAAICQR